jgi:mycofactocin precursor peptide peptidase
VSRRLEHMTWPDVAASSPIVAIPVGSCEQHGPHLPLGTDALIAIALAERLGERVEGVVVGPAVAIGASGEHAGFPGTLSLGTTATAAGLVEIVRSADWARGTVLVNAHGGNAEALRATSATAAAEGRRLHVWSPRPAPGDDAHAGHTETSVMLALHPGLVDAAELAAGDVRPLSAIAGQLRDDGVAAVSANGVLGDPTTATAIAGRAVLDAWTEDLVASARSAIAAWGGREPAR